MRSLLENIVSADALFAFLLFELFSCEVASVTGLKLLSKVAKKLNSSSPTRRFFRHVPIFFVDDALCSLVEVEVDGSAPEVDGIDPEVDGLETGVKAERVRLDST